MLTINRKKSKFLPYYHLVQDIIAGGTETSAITVVWAMTELMKNPTIMRKVQDELRTLIQGKTFINMISQSSRTLKL